MKLNTFDKDTINQEESNGSRLTFVKNGVLNINAVAAEIMKLKAGDKIALSQDERKPENWYIHKSPNGFQVRDSNKWQKKAGCAGLMEIYCEAFEKKADKNISFTIASESIKAGKFDLFQIFEIEE